MTRYGYHLVYSLALFAICTLSAGLAFAQNPAIETNKGDYQPGDTVIVTGSAWMAGETVQLVFVEEPLIHEAETLITVADANGDIHNDEYIIQGHDLGQTFTLTATGLTSGWTAVTWFTDGTITITSNTNWSDLDDPDVGGTQPPSDNDAIIVTSGATLTVDVSDAVCASIGLGSSGAGTNGTLVFNSGSQVTVSGNIVLGKTGAGAATGTLTMTSGGTLKIGGAFTAPNLGTFTPGTGTIEYNGTGAQTILATASLGATAYNNLIISGARTINSITLSTISLTGDYTSNATFTSGGYTVGSTTVTFNGNNVLQTISGSGATAAFNNITVDKGTSNTNVLDVQSVVTMRTSTTPGSLTLTNGTFKLSSASTITPFGGSTTIPSSAGYHLNHASAVSNWGSTGSLTLSGILTIANGTMTIGSASGNSILFSTGSTLTFEGGTTNVAGRLSGGTIAQTTTFTMSSGTLNLNTVGSTSATLYPFDLQATGSSFTMSGGTIVIRKEGGTGTQDLGYRNLATTTAVTGGTLQIGDASSPTAQTMNINSTAPIFNLTVNGSAAVATKPTAFLEANFTVKGNLTIDAGTTLDANSKNISLAGDWSNSSAFTPGTGKLIMNGASGQTMSGTSFYDLEINNAAGLTILSDETVTHQLTLTSGNITTGANTMIISSGATVSRTSGHIVGNLQMFFGTGDIASQVFDIGTSDAYTPATVDIGTGGTGTAGTLTASTTGASHSQIATSGLDVNKDINRFWTLSPGSAALGGRSYLLRVEFPVGEVGGATLGNFEFRRYNSGWNTPTGGSYLRTETAFVATVQYNNFTDFSDFAVGEPCTPPGATASGGTLTCTTTSVVLSASTTFGSSFSWSGPGIVSGGDGANPTVSSAGIYTVTVTNSAGGCTSAATALVNLNNTPPGASALGGTLTCTTTSVVLSASSGGGTSFSWAGTGITNGSTTANPTVSSAGTFTVTVTNSANGCTSTTTALVNEDKATPGASATGGTLTCTTTSVVLSAAGGGTSFSWSGPGIVSGNTTANPTVSSSGTYTVTVTNTANGCTSTATAPVNSNIDAPGASATGGTLTCTTTSVILSAAGGGTQFSWAGPGIVSGNTTSNPTVSSSGTYTVTVTNTANGCTSTATASVIQTVSPPGASATGGTLTCTTTSVVLSAAGGGTGFSWAGPGIVSGPGTSNPTVSSTGTYTLTVTDVATGCTSTATASVNDDVIPPGASTTGGTLTCTTTSVVLSAAPTAGTSFSWTGPAIVAGETTANPTVSATGTYTVTITKTANGCTSTATASVNDDIIPPGASTTGGTLTCTTTSVVLSAAPTAGTSFSWTGPGIISGETTANPTVSVTGTYTVTITKTANGCTSTATTSVNDNLQAPGASATGGTLTCTTTSIVLSAGTDYGTGFSWSGPGIVSGNTTANPTVSASGIYTVTVTNSANGCTSTATAPVDKTALPTTTVSSGPTSQTVVYGSAIADVYVTGTDAETQGSDLMMTCQYKKGSDPFGPGLPTGLDSVLFSTVPGPPGAATWRLSGNITADVGVYTIRATVTDVDGCSSYVDITITVVPACVGPIALRMYIGTLFSWTTSATSSTATLTLSAGLKACTLGDIRTAKVTFAIRNGTTWSAISGASNLPVGLVDPGDLTQGTATAIVQYNIGNTDALDLQVAIIVTGNFASNDPSQDALVVIAKPGSSSSIGICGQIANGNPTDSRGFIKGADDDFTQFFLKVTFNKKGTNPQGKVSAILHSFNNPDGSPSIDPGTGLPKLRTYKIVSTAISVLAADATKGTASFSSKANVVDCTDAANPISIDGGATLQVEMTDYDKGTRAHPTVRDSISIYLLKKSGGVWFANKLDGNLRASKVPVVSGIGDIIVSEGLSKEGEDFIPEEYALFQNYPNPFNPSTTIQFDLPEESRVSITIYDILGRDVLRLVDGVEAAGRYRKFWEGQDRTGNSLASGVYFIRIDAKSVESERKLTTLKKMLLLK